MAPERAETTRTLSLARSRTEKPDDGDAHGNHSAAAKEYRGRQQFIDEVLAPFGARFAGGEPFRPVTIRGVFSDDDTVVVIWDGRGIANDGQPYQNSYAWIMKLDNGKVVDGTAFFDSISFNDLWARVQPS